MAADTNQQMPLSSRPNDCIRVCSRKKLDKAISSILEPVKRTIARNPAWSSDVKEKFSKRVEEIYGETIYQNLLIDGKLVWSGEEEESTNELEPFDPTKIDHVHGDILPGVNSAVVKVAQLRKTYPRECVRKLAQQCKHEYVELEEMKYRSIKTDTGEETTAGADGLLTAAQHMQQFVQPIPELTKSFASLEGQLHTIHQAKFLMDEMKGCLVNQILFSRKNNKRKHEIYHNDRPCETPNNSSYKKLILEMKEKGEHDRKHAVFDLNK